MTQIVVGAAGIFLAALLGGATGFGFGLVAAPSLLAAGLPLREVVAANLAIALLTRLAAVPRLRRHLVRPRAARLIGGAVPGILAGLAVRGTLDTGVLKIGVGLVAIGAALAIAFRPGDRDGAPAGAATTLAAGAGGGFLGVTTSLNGVPPALLLTRDRVEQMSFVADLTVYFIVSNALTLALLTATDPDVLAPLGRYVAFWLPAGILGNQLGIRAAGRIPYRVFRGISLGVILTAGCATIATAL
ncbi:MULTISPECIES: sulfite exporter TauE/SafE family protein [Actinomadura]|uniref:Probable membrane transporter protein n=1 Tax=Actinomadura madurae TaxID=1993 RepID=A0A1I5WQP6_9ACTN|nr:sulfite exporter TauE/SafE family protein [Actinomadura madurae]SFQ21838.1 hypothetical protein SAMN04489713_12477 [Actinomadura madurae]